MNKSESFKNNIKLKQLILSKDSFLLEDDELYQLIKEDFHEKQRKKALTLVKPYLYITFSEKKNKNLYHQMLKESSEKNKKTLNSFSHFRIEDNPEINSNKIKNTNKTKNKNNIPLPNIRRDTTNLSTSIQNSNIKENLKNKNNIIATEIKVNNSNSSKKGWHNRSLSAQNYTFISIKKKNKNRNNLLNHKISLDKLLYLRSKFFANEKMSRGELTEMMFGNQIPFYKHKSICDDMQNKIYEVLCNNPKLILDLIEKGYVDKKDVIDYFNIKSINISWNDNLEKKFREVVYNKIKTNSNMLKTSFFLVNIGFHRILRQKFEDKNFRNTFTYNQEEIDEFSKIYEKLKKYNLNILLEGYSKVDAIYHLREVIINDMIDEIRDKYYHKKLSKFFKNKNKSDIIVEKVVEKEKKELEDMKNYVFHIREYKEMKLFPNKHINKLRFSKSITKINKSIKEVINIKDICIVDKIKKNKNYIKEKIKFFQKQGIFPSISSPKNYKFEWKEFMNENKENRKIIKYCIIMIQAKFRGFMVKVFLAKLIRSVDIIITNLDKYLQFKKLVLRLYKTTFDEIIWKRNDNTIFKNSIKEIRIFIKFIIKNNKSRKLVFKKNEIDLINKLSESEIEFRPLKEEQAVYSVKLLLILDKFLFYLYHGYIDNIL